MTDQLTLEQLKAKAPDAAAFLRWLANSNRLLLLCHISQGERSVAQIMNELGLKQPALSQQLAELRRSGFVQTRRQSRSILYSIKDQRVLVVMEALCAVFFGDGGGSQPKLSAHGGHNE